MNTIVEAHKQAASRLSEEAKSRLLAIKGEPALRADWLHVVFIHFEVDAATLRREVPFELDLFENRAYVSLVAFHVHHLRTPWGGRVAEWLFAPFATRELFNLRTYVRHQGERAIYFFSEWMTNRLVAPLAPLTYGLPYRLGRIHYRHEHETAAIRGQIEDARTGLQFRYEGNCVTRRFELPEAGSLEEFLLEQYSCFTQQGRTRRLYRIWHPPWPQARIEIKVLEGRLLTRNWPWMKEARQAGAHYSPGVREVLIGRPHRMRAAPRRRVLSSFYEMP